MKPARSLKSGIVQVRMTLDEMEYLTEQAERLEVTLSEAVRAAVARSYLVDRSAGRTTVESWINPVTDELLDADDD
jgi:hypothetical protein